MIQFQKKYFLLAILLFLTEVAIALFVHDRIVRPYIGDVLVVILIYCFVRSFFNVPVIKLSIAVLLFAYLIEISQYYNFLTYLGLQDIKVARIVMGVSFEWIDMLCYTVGILIVIAVENKRLAKHRTEVSG